MKVRRGFTLIEILVVIGIIMFLAAFVIVAAVRFGNNSREQATRAMIQRLGMGINKYYGTYRVYPAETNMSLKTMSIYKFLCPVAKPPFMDFNQGEIRNFGGVDWAVDAWGKQILYYSAGEAGGTKTADENAISQAMVGNFKLVSAGPNGIEGDADDISLSKVNY